VTPPVVLTIGGSDSSGASGVQADLKTFAALKVYGASVLTAVAAKNTRATLDIFALPANVVAAQLAALVGDLPLAAVKTGTFPTADTLAAVVTHARAGDLPNLVVDPVLIPTGTNSRRSIAMALERLLPYALVATPNRDEASALLGWQVATPADMAGAASQLAAGGARYVVVTGGDLVTGDEAIDAVWADGSTRYMHAPRIASRNSQGSGAVFSAAVAARLAVGEHVLDALAFAKGLIGRAISDAADWRLGNGPGPMDVFGWSSLRL
jgi:hydroxymethylpyrimidine kinase/phosphomethylpyrimidine kinase